MQKIRNKNLDLNTNGCALNVFKCKLHNIPKK